MTTETQNKRRHSTAPWFIAQESVGRYEVYSRAPEGSFSVATFTKKIDAQLGAAAPALLAANKRAMDTFESIAHSAMFRALGDDLCSEIIATIGCIDEAIAQAARR